MNYLIQKLEFRQKKIIKYKNIFTQINSFESFYSQRNELYILLNNLEEDLKQAAFALKALVMQNKTLVKEIAVKKNEAIDLSNKLNITLGENENLKLKLSSLTEKNVNVVDYELYSHSNTPTPMNNNLVNVNIDSIKVDDEKEYDEPKIQNLELNNNANRINKPVGNNNKNNDNSNKYEQLSNVKNILNDMRNNKRTLKRIIEQHFQEQNSQNKSNENQ